MRKILVQLLVVVLVVSLLSGCMSIRAVTTLKPAPDAATATLGEVKVHLVDVSPGLQAQARALYPNIFSDHMTAIPVGIREESKSHSPFSPTMLLFAFTLYALPGYMSTTTDYTVSTEMLTRDGKQLLEPVQFKVKHAEWGSILTPLALIPVPGPSDRRAAGNMSDTSLYNIAWDLADKARIEAVVRSLRQADPAILQEAYADRSSRLRPVTLNGQQMWSFLGFRLPAATEKTGAGEIRRAAVAAVRGRSGAAEGEQATAGAASQVATVSIYRDMPTWQATPLETVVVAKRSEDGRWQPMNGYLRSARTLTAVSTLLENGKPSQIVVRTVTDPPVEDFIDTPTLTGAEAPAVLRWNNGILLEAKNRSLPKFLQEKSKDELVNMVTRIEQAALNLNEQAEQAKDRAQAMVEKGEGDPAPQRELAILCRQRIEVLKPILAELRQEIAARRE